MSLFIPLLEFNLFRRAAAYAAWKRSVDAKWRPNLLKRRGTAFATYSRAITLPSMATLSGSAGDLGHSTADLVFANYRELVHPDEG